MPPNGTGSRRHAVSEAPGAPAGPVLLLATEFCGRSGRSVVVSSFGHAEAQVCRRIVFVRFGTKKYSSTCGGVTKAGRNIERESI